MTTKAGPAPIQNDDELEMLFMYAVEGFKAKIDEKFSYHDVIGKLHLYECIVTGQKPTSPVYLKLSDFARRANLEFLKQMETFAIIDQYIHAKASIRSDLERNLFNNLIKLKVKNPFVWKQFHDLASKSHQNVPPDPQRVKDIKKQIDTIHANKLHKLIRDFAMFTHAVQTKVIAALNKNQRAIAKLGQISRPWVSDAEMHLKQLFSKEVKREVINSLFLEKKKRDKTKLVSQFTHAFLVQRNRHQSKLLKQCKNMMTHYGVDQEVSELPKERSTKHQRKLFS